MPRFRVLLTDYAWPDLEIENSIFRGIDAELITPANAAEATLVAMAANVDAIMTNWARVTENVIRAAPACRIVSRMGIGLDNIAVDFCTRQGIPVTNVPDYCLIEVAEHALALVLALGRKIGFYHALSKSGSFNLQAGPPLRRIAGQTLGIVGYGNIGRTVATKAAGLGLRVVVTGRARKPTPPGVEWLTLGELLKCTDYVSLHVPLNSATRHMIGAEQLALLKPSAYLINTARGGLVDHSALAAALAAGKLAGCGLDVTEPEPPDLATAPYNDPRVIVTPHAAFVSEESLRNLRTRAARQVADRLLGKPPENVVNGVACETQDFRKQPSGETA
jgi:D-3-phosphoglycerate dehydrogenase